MHMILTSEDTGGKWLVRYEDGILYLYPPGMFNPEVGGTDPNYIARAVTASSNPKRALRRVRKLIRAHDREERRQAQFLEKVRTVFEEANRE